MITFTEKLKEIIETFKPEYCKWPGEWKNCDCSHNEWIINDEARECERGSLSCSFDKRKKK